MGCLFRIDLGSTYGGVYLSFFKINVLPKFFQKPYDDEHFDLQNNHENNSEESPTLGSDEVEVKLPCRSVSINVVGMASNNDEVNSRPSPCSNDFQGMNI